MSSKQPGANITDDQIRELRDAAEKVGDKELILICDCALSDGIDPRENCRKYLADLIAGIAEVEGNGSGNGGAS